MRRYVIIALTALMILLSACRQEDTVTEEEIITLRWIQRFDYQEDLPLVQAELNRMTREKLGIEVEIVQIDTGSYNKRMRNIISSGQPYDICFTSHLENDLYVNISRGAFVSLNELLAEYGPETYASIDEEIWEATSVEGEIYAVINLQTFVKPGGIYVREDMLEKYGFDLNAVTELKDLEPLLAAVKDGENDTAVPWDAYRMPQYIRDGMGYLGFEEIGRNLSPGVISIDGDDYELINQYDTEAMKELVSLMRDWYLKGYIYEDAAILQSPAELRSQGRVTALFNNYKYGGMDELNLLMGGETYAYQPLTEDYITTAYITDTAQAISSASKHPEEAMAFIELLNTDQEVYNLVSFGIEGIHYNKVGDNRIELIENSGYNHNKAWAMGNNFNAYLYGNQPDDTWEMTRQINESSERSRILGFVFNEENVKAEMNQCLRVIDEYMPALWTGSVDPDTYYDEFLLELGEAGADIILQEKQRQLDAWLVNKGKE